MDAETLTLMAAKSLKEHRANKAAKRAEEKEKRHERRRKAQRHEKMLKRSLRAKQTRRREMRAMRYHHLRKVRRSLYRWERRRIINHRYYLSHIKKRYIRRRLHKGDENGVFSICIVKNMRHQKALTCFRWRVNSFNRFREMVDGNHSSSVCPIVCETGKRGASVPVKYEILIRKRIDPESETNEAMFRDDMGVAVTVKTDDPKWLIIAKEIWYVEEDFYLYGHHPKYGRKTAPWIIENVIEKNIREDGICRIFLWKSYMFIEGDCDFTFVMAKNTEEAARLYNILYDKLNGMDGLFFTGALSKMAVQRWVDRIADKTGWKENTIRNCNPVV